MRKDTAIIFRNTLIVLAAMLLPVSHMNAQSDSTASLTKKFDQYRNNILQEKIFAHIDRPMYLTGETMWFNLYYTDASFHRPLDISKVAYAEILNKDNKPVLQIKIQLQTGGGHGSFFLPASLSSGTYLFRAYTSWMKNFSPEIFFQQAVTIVNPFTKLGLTEAKEDNQRYDIQFFPEGGNLLIGTPNRVGFRAVDRFGKGISLNGSIINEQNDTVVHFRPHKFGLGNFTFTPALGHSYTAVINTGGRKTKYALPSGQTEGYLLKVSDTLTDKIKIRVLLRGQNSLPPFCYVFIHTRETQVTLRQVYFQNGSAEILLDKSKVGEGISHITAFNPELKPMGERLYFKMPENMNLTAMTDAEHYNTRKKVTLNLNTAKSAASSALSVSVYKLDSLNAYTPIDIRTWLWISSELKGTVESPEYYLTDGKDDRDAMNNLLLTHGWSRYQWSDILNKHPDFEFMPEFRGHIVTGKVTGADLGKGKRITTYLSNPDKNIRLYPSRSSASGKVKYELHDFFGPRKLIAQTNTQIDSIYDIKINSPFAEGFSSWKPAEFSFSRNLTRETTERSLYMQVQNTFHEPKSDRFFIPSTDTTAFYGKADESYWLDDYTRFPTMEEVMREYVPGVLVRKRKGHFHFMTLDNSNAKVFRDDPLVLLDGVPVFSIDRIIAMDPRKVKKLEVMTRKYFLGPLSFEGISSYTTYNGDLSDFELDRRALVVDYEGLQFYREFFSPVYDTEQKLTDRTPDVRNVIYWNPELKTDAAGNAICEFYTPDVAGKYKAVIQGLGADGKPGAASTTFDVAK